MTTLLQQAGFGGPAALFRWWLRALSSLFWPLSGWAARHDRRGLILELGRKESTLLKRTANGERSLGTAVIDASDYDERLQALILNTQSRKPALTIRLQPGLGLRKTLDLPLAALHDLKQLLDFEIDRLTPFRLEGVYHTHHVLGIDREAGRISVQWYIAPRCEVERALQTAHNLGFEAIRVELATKFDANPDSVHLYSQNHADVTSASRLDWPFAMLALGLTALALVIPVQDQLATMTALEVQLASARADAQVSLVLQKRLDQVSAKLHILRTLKSSRLTTTEIFAELTRFLPDDAYIVQFHLHDNMLQLHGVAENASNLLVALAKSSILKEPHFGSRVTIDQRSGLERFHVLVELTNAGHS